MIELEVSPVLGLWTVMRKANKDRLWWHPACNQFFDSGRPLQPWWLRHLNVLVADRHVVFVPLTYDLCINWRAVVTVSGSLLLPQLDALYRADIAALRELSRETPFRRPDARLEGVSRVAVDRARRGGNVVCHQPCREPGQQADLI